jgi:hypothetical protein
MKRKGHRAIQDIQKHQEKKTRTFGRVVGDASCGIVVATRQELHWTDSGEKTWSIALTGDGSGRKADRNFLTRPCDSNSFDFSSYVLSS